MNLKGEPQTEDEKKESYEGLHPQVNVEVEIVYDEKGKAKVTKYDK